MKPPWQIPCPFAIASVIVIDSRAPPGATSSNRMPSPRLARSSAHIASARTRTASVMYASGRQPAFSRHGRT